jgi:hypothetical protein
MTDEHLAGVPRSILDTDLYKVCARHYAILNHIAQLLV